MEAEVVPLLQLNGSRGRPLDGFFTDSPALLHRILSRRLPER